MHASIGANSNGIHGVGKTIQVHAKEFNVALTGSGNAQSLAIFAQASEDIGTGERGGSPKTIHRELTLLLTQPDLELIFQAAIEHSMLNPKLIDELEAAKAHIDAAIMLLAKGK